LSFVIGPMQAQLFKGISM